MKGAKEEGKKGGKEGEREVGGGREGKEGGME